MIFLVLFRLPFCVVNVLMFVLSLQERKACDKIRLRHKEGQEDEMIEKIDEIQEQLAGAEKVLVGLGEEWKWNRQGEDAKERREELVRAYEKLYQMLQNKDYFIVTLATDALIYETSLGSKAENVISTDKEEDAVSCPSENAETLAVMERLFPSKKRPEDTRWQRIVAPCGNETWRQCSAACTKDIWEPGEVPNDICPHCGAPLTGNTVEANPYIEEGYLPQWNRYTQWLTRTLNRETLILELGAGFGNPGVIRFPFEKTAFFNRKSHLCRVHAQFPQITQELADRAVGIKENSVEWVNQIKNQI